MVNVQANPEENECQDRSPRNSASEATVPDAVQEPKLEEKHDFDTRGNWICRNDSASGSASGSEESEYSHQVESVYDTVYDGEDERNEGTIENLDSPEDDEIPTDGWTQKKVVTTCFDPETNRDGYDQAIQQVIPNLDETNIGDVNITNSKHVHIGNTNFYKGPVTIKQFVYTNSYPGQIKTDEINEKVNGRTSNVDQEKLDRDLPTGPWSKVKEWLMAWRHIRLCIILLSLVTIMIVVSVVLITKAQSTGDIVIPTSGTRPEDEAVNGVRFIERNDWIAQPPTEPLNNLTETPVPFVIISHTASDQCFTQSECVQRVRRIQTFHIEGNGWSDIGYSFLVGGDGLAYVGRGWDAEGAHSFGYNRKSIGISFIGTFNDIVPPRNQVLAGLNVIKTGLNMSKISPEYKVLGHRQVSRTLSPGDKLYAIIQKWDHWSPYPPPNSATYITGFPTALIFILLLHVLNYL